MHTVRTLLQILQKKSCTTANK